MNDIIDNPDIRWHIQHVKSSQRASQKNQKPCIIWFTGLSGAGKSTLANAVDKLLFEHNKHTYLLDGDNVRHGLSKDLGFSTQDRIENIRRIGEVGKLFVDSGLIVLSAFISPFRSDRQMVRNLFPLGDFIEIYVSTELKVCEKRDPKGLYKKARAGEIRHFTGIDSEYEVPESPELDINAGEVSVESAAKEIFEYLIKREFV